MKHTALANVRMLYKCFAELNRPDIDVVGVGGVHSGRDAFELILCVRHPIHTSCIIQSKCDCNG